LFAGNHRYKIIILAILIFIPLACSHKGKEEKKNTKSTRVNESETVKNRNQENLPQNMERSIANHPPQIVDISITPQLPMTGDQLKVNVKTSDPDGDQVTCHYYWFINDQAIDDDSPALNRPIKRGDRVKVKVVATDGSQSSQAVWATAKVGNAPPIARLKDQKISGNEYIAFIDAKDPEGDPLFFELKEGPPNMKIDGTGKIEWPIPPGTSGSYEIVASVKDNEGDETQISYRITIRGRNESTEK